MKDDKKKPYWPDFEIADEFDTDIDLNEYAEQSEAHAFRPYSKPIKSKKSKFQNNKYNEQK